MICIYDYTNYRRFLEDKFADNKRKNSLFSYRSFNRLAGLKSSGFLKLVIDGKRNLADEGIQKIAKGFRLEEPDRDYFGLLVRFNQAKTNDEKDRYFRELARNERFLKAKPLAAAQFQLFSHWYYVTILELVRIQTTALKNFAWFQKNLHPRVELRDIKTAVKELKKLSLLEEDKTGSLQRKEAMLATGDEVASLAVSNFHLEMSEQAQRALRHEASDQREFSGLTILTSEQSFQKAKEEIQSFRKRLHSILEQENQHEKNFVAHINFQLFKLSKVPEAS